MERINWATIVLIPKTNCPEIPADFWPTSLINSALKIISKVLALKLSKLIDSIVDDIQSVSIKGRCILDNIFVAKELIFSIHKRQMIGHIIDVDFAKAFDMVDWDFFCLIFYKPMVLAQNGSIGLGPFFLRPKPIYVLVNGEMHGYVRHHRGLRQGDPLSSLLFALVSNVLSLMFNHALESSVLYGVPLGH